MIFTALQREILLVWSEWEVEVDGQHEVDDAYGQPGFESRIWVRREGRADSRTMFSGACGDTARDIYRHITGQSFASDDGLGDEPCHPAENGAWPDAQHKEGGEESAEAA
ncbi:hypothetical protein [Paraburkholderia tropica]|uniref:hypothetical protein n=1 Tax=Paraburkholderia tropica TaxID=92647 RepID=UPI0007ECE2E4|nr:hypothetical protein [Paraburkholderia tropica]OBR50539.1 hypothetical protein A6456_33945 [Paraburkholderia tropica]